MICRNTQYPDTCGCVIEYEFDEGVPSDFRVHTLVAVHHRCSAHAALIDAAVYAAVLSEQNRKSAVEGRLRTAHAADLMDPITGALDWTWSYNARRELVVDLPRLALVQRTTLQAWADTALGAGRVQVR